MLSGQKIVCPKCSYKNDYGKRFCSNCHSELPNPYRLPYALNPRVLAGTCLGDRLPRRIILLAIVILIGLVLFICTRDFVGSLIVDLESGDPRERARAAKILGEINDARVVEPLIAALKDENPKVREEAVWAIGETETRRAVEPLVIALRDENSGVRASVATVLGQTKDPRAVEHLIGALRDKDMVVRSRVEEALVEITGESFGENPVKWQEWWEKKKQRFFNNN